MDEFSKVTPGKKQVIEVLENLRPFEAVNVVADKEGKPDTFFVTRTSKFIISGAFITFVK